MKWQSIKKDKPEVGGYYLVTDGEDVSIMTYCGETDNTYEWLSFGSPAIFVTHWLPILTVEDFKINSNRFKYKIENEKYIIVEKCF